MVLWDMFQFQFDWYFNTGEQDLDIGISAFLYRLVCFSLTGVLTLESKAWTSLSVHLFMMFVWCVSV